MGLIDSEWLPSDDERIALAIREVMKKGHYEWHERNVLRQLLQPHHVVLELGTGIGYLASWCAKRCLRVVTCDPNDSLRPIIFDTFQKNGVFPIFIPLAVSWDGERRSLTKDEAFWAIRTVEGQDHPTIALGWLLQLVAPNVLVMDIEGSEEEFTHLTGFLLSSVQVVVVEVHGDNEKVVRDWLVREDFKEVFQSANVIGWVRN